VIDQDFTANKEGEYNIVCGVMLRIEHEIFLLALRAEKRNLLGLTNQEYVMSTKWNGRRFYEFKIRSLITASGWLMIGVVVVVCLDNAKIHSDGTAKYIEDLLWNYYTRTMGGQPPLPLPPLRVLV
jgi:hypothetical protein